MNKINMSILDYTFVRLYFWYKRRFEKYDHKKLVSASVNGFLWISAFLSLEILICLDTFSNNDNYSNLIMYGFIAVFFVPIYVFTSYYSNEDRAENLIREYEDLDEAQHAFFKRKTRFIIFLIQILCASLVGHRIFFQ